ncbi:MAG: hypothetical protein KDD47_06210 [Acidobacteria bacterium]|nr:hypothetical protein [Acidobacteriota bacterium]
MRRFFTAPFTDALFGLDRCMARGVSSLALVSLGLLLGWWLYVPVHELLHAAGCMLAGGTVTRLEISPIYLGGALASWIPWVEAGGEYAGRLSGFDTRGSDAVYLLTDFAPFLLTLFPGVWLLRCAARAGRPLAFGLSLPLAFAPFTSITGDAYEIGSILITRLKPWSDPGRREILRGDDLFQKVSEVSGGSLWLGLVLASMLGLLWAYSTYALGDGLARTLGHPPVPHPKYSPEE